jgi:hypothetical protein
MEALNGLREAGRAALARAAPFFLDRDLAIAGGALIAAVVVLYLLFDTLSYAAVPTLSVPLKQEELAETLDAPKYVPAKSPPKDKIPCYDPGTMQLLGYAKAMTPDEVGGAAAGGRQRAARAARSAPAAGAWPRAAPAMGCRRPPHAPYARRPTNWARRGAPPRPAGARRHRQGQGGLQGGPRAGGPARPPPPAAAAQRRRAGPALQPPRPRGPWCGRQRPAAPCRAPPAASFDRV